MVYFFLAATPAPAYEPRGRTMNPPSSSWDDRRGGNNGYNNNKRDSSGDASLSREKNSAATVYVERDGEFTSYPEI